MHLYLDGSFVEPLFLYSITNLAIAMFVGRTSLSHTYCMKLKSSSASCGQVLKTSASASAYTTVPDTDGKTVSSSTFPINRGVLQGDSITSPLYFILTLELILRKFDARVDKGVPLADVILHTLGYADDVALIEYGDDEGTNRLSERVTAIKTGSKILADMDVNISKTKNLHVRKQEAVSKTTQAEARARCNFKCPHPGCGHVFLTKRGRNIHAGKC